MNNLVEQLPRMLSGNALVQQLTVLPEYSEGICDEDMSTRLLALSDMYDIYIPSKMSAEIYSKLYLAMLHSLEKKTTNNSVVQRNQNFKRYSNGIIGGSDSFTIIGCSGIGKSSAIFSALRLIGNQILINSEPYMKVVPIVNVQCPFDCSVKSLLFAILKAIDEEMGSSFYRQSTLGKTTTDYLINTVSQCCLNHVGLIVIDEIQNVVTHKNGFNLVGSLTQLINSSGISICMVGTPKVAEYFTQEMQLARRTLGLRYFPLSYDDYFVSFCKTVFNYQYVKYRSEITEGILEWLYEHSSGVISVVVSLLHDAQEMAILSGKEKLDLEALNRAYAERMLMLHGYIEKPVIKKSNNKKKLVIPTNEAVQTNISLYDVAMEAKEKGISAVSELKKYFNIMEVKVR